MERVLAQGAQKIFTLLCQALMVVGAFVVANNLRYDWLMPPDYQSAMLSLLVPLTLIKLSCFILTHLLSGWWRYVSIHDLVSLVKANTLGSLAFAFYLSYLSNSTIHLSSSILLIDGLICFLAMSGSRVAVRLVREYTHVANKTVSNGTEKILIVGAGAAGQSIAREIRQNPHQNRRVIGFVDQDEKRIKQRFEGVPVLASIENLKELLVAQPVNLVIMANPALCHKELRKIVMICQSCGIKSKVLPNVDEILSDNVAIRHIRDVKLEDLLGRPPVHMDVRNIRNYLENRSVLVTGAAGSIGQEICSQVAGFGVKSLILFDNAETPLFQIERNLRAKFPNLKIIPSLSDIRNPAKVAHVFDLYRPQVVFHAAAYKHVPMSENNPISAIENNTLGTRTLVDTARCYGVDHFVMVSTDKAVNPTNIMGASKRAAEIYAQTFYNQAGTTVVTVRFGNVLGSNGSVVPIFREQIDKGGPVTVTDPEATRFFMTIPEAVQLVLQAGSMGHGGEIFLLNMGEQIRILHLAEELIRLSGMVPYHDIDINFTGLRPGEKLHEELLLANEGVKPTSHNKICVAKSVEYNPHEIDRLFEQLAEGCRLMDEKLLINAIKALVPEYSSTQDNVLQNVHVNRTEASGFIEQKVVQIPLNAVGTA